MTFPSPSPSPSPLDNTWKYDVSLIHNKSSFNNKAISEKQQHQRMFAFDKDDMHNSSRNRSQAMQKATTEIEHARMKRARSFDATLALASPPKKLNAQTQEQEQEQALAERHGRKRGFQQDGESGMDIDGHTAKICKNNGFLDNDDDDVVELEPVTDFNASQSSRLHGIDLFTASNKQNDLLNLIDDQPIESDHSLLPAFKQVSVYPPAMKMLNRNALVELRRFADGQLPKSTALLPSWMCKNVLFAPQKRAAGDGDLMEQEHSSVKIEELMDDEAMVEDFRSNVRLGVD